MIDPKVEAVLLDYINSTPAMQSLLHDLGMLPEEIMSRAGKAYRKNPDWVRMLVIADHWREQESTIVTEEQ